MQREASGGTTGTSLGVDGSHSGDFDQLNASVGSPGSRPTSGSPRNTSLRSKVCISLMKHVKQIERLILQFHGYIRSSGTLSYQPRNCQMITYNRKTAI